MFTHHARRTAGQTLGHRDNHRRTTLTQDHRIIRSRAHTNGHTLPATGRISPTVLRAYHDAH